MLVSLSLALPKVIAFVLGLGLEDLDLSLSHSLQSKLRIESTLHPQLHSLFTALIENHI